MVKYIDQIIHLSAANKAPSLGKKGDARKYVCAIL